MATQPQFTAQVKDAPDIPGEGKPRRQIDHVDALTAGPDNLETLYQVFQHGLKQSEGGPMVLLSNFNLHLSNQ